MYRDGVWVEKARKEISKKSKMKKFEIQTSKTLRNRVDEFALGGSTPGLVQCLYAGSYGDCSKIWLVVLRSMVYLFELRLHLCLARRDAPYRLWLFRKVCGDQKQRKKDKRMWIKKAQVMSRKRVYREHAYVSQLFLLDAK